MIRISIILVITILMASCYANRQKLVGKWVAYAYYDGNNTHTDTIDVTTIRLGFDEDGNYTFQSPLNYSESGKFRTSGNTLIIYSLVDSKAKNERRMAIKHLTTDSLMIEMNENGTKQLLKMVRE